MTSHGRILMWFRADLRLGDNTALWHASRESGGNVVASFVICPDQWAEHDWAGVKVDFILRNLRTLSADLKRLNIPLLILEAPRFQDCPDRLIDLARQHRCAAVYFNKEYELNERRRDAAVAERFAEHALQARGFTDQTLVEPGEVRTAGGAGGFFTVFTPFKRSLYRIIEERGGIETLSGPCKQEPMGIAASEVPSTVRGFTSHVQQPETLWPAGEKHALARLGAFIQSKCPLYKDQRDFPALDGTSSLSPHLSVGSISPRQCVRTALDANSGTLDGGNSGIACWISEVAWREFYKHILVGYPRVCRGRAFKPETERLPWNDDAKQFRAWCEGLTGVPLVDAGMRQLAATGWMHNRVRMVTAMYLTKDLFIDWRWGERHFMRHLIDGDLASNNGGWQWSASTGTDAAPYFRIFNPISQSRRFDPEGAYIRRYVPELVELEGGEKGAIHDPSELPALLRARLDYPLPIVDHARARDHVLKAFQSLG